MTIMQLSEYDNYEKINSGPNYLNQNLAMKKHFLFGSATSVFMLRPSGNHICLTKVGRPYASRHVCKTEAQTYVPQSNKYLMDDIFGIVSISNIFLCKGAQWSKVCPEQIFKRRFIKFTDHLSLLLLQGRDRFTNSNMTKIRL
jgi:hypothetical protein